MTARRRRLLGALTLTSVVGLTGCARGCTSSRPPIHLNPSMDHQPKVRAQTASTFFYDGASMRQPIPGTVAVGGLKEDTAFFTGKGADGQFVAAIPHAVDETLLERGRQRYSIYCQPCHDARGDGKGILFQRGNVPTASFHQEKILKYPDGQIFDVITNGTGLMAGYRWPIPPADRWAIVAYVRGLQRERQSRAASAPASANATADTSAKLRRTSPRATAEGGSKMNGVMNRKLLFVLGPVTGLVMFGAVLMVATFLTNREYKEPYRAPAAVVDPTPRAAGLEAERAAAEASARAKPYVEAEYRAFPVVGSRVAIWAVAQLHLLFAAFVLAVPIFAVLIEAIGYKTGDKRYDRLAYEFTKLLSVSFSLTATFGAFLTFMLIALYPKFTNYLMSVFSPTFLPYVLLFFLEAFFLYTYYYGWGKFHPLVHLGLGIGLNVVGTGIMLIANAWLTFMMSPAGISDSGAVISVSDAITNYTWMPINVHRVIANVAFGGSVAAAYAAFKFLQAETDEERAHYDWMGYIGNFVAIISFLPLPFAGYWLAKEIYAYSQTLGLTMMGGAFSWLFIIQAVLIGNLFLGANYYLWLGMGRVEGAQPFQRFVKYLLAAIVLCFMIWATPRSIIATVSEIRAMGGGTHPILGFLGVMSAKNTAVNILILTTFMSFLLYRRTGKIATVTWAKTGQAVQLLIFAAAAIFVIFLGVYGYFVEASVRIGLSVPQVSSVLFAMVAITAIDIFLYRRPKNTGETRWGRMPAISQYVLIFIAVTFTWLMGLMGYVRSGLRQHWHVYGVIRDTSPDAFTPTLGFATQVVSATVLVFFLLIGFVFWLASLHDRPDFERRDQGPPPPRLRRGLAGVRRGNSRRSRGGRRDDPAPGQDRSARPREHGVLYVCRPVGAAEGSSASSGNRHQERLDHRRNGQDRQRDHGRQGTLPDLPHDRQERGAQVSRPRRGRRPRSDPRSGPERGRVLRPIDVRA